MPNLNLSQKTIDLLRLLAMPRTAERWKRADFLVTLYGNKPVQRKLEELSRRGYIEYGMFPLGWLTDKGKSILRALDEAANPEVGP